MPATLQYETPDDATVAVPRRVTFVRRAGGFRVVLLPPPAAWQAAVALALGILLVVCLLAGLAMALAHVLRRGKVDWAQLACAGVALAALAGATVWMIRRLSGVPRMARTPTVISASPDGLSVSSARSGRVRRYDVPIERITAVAVRPGSWTVTDARYRYVHLVVRAGWSSVTFRFVTPERDLPRTLESFLCEGLRGSPAARAKLSWWRTMVCLSRTISI